jgi:antitoxin (DNA-binding transcriptional repressor) of toxin-antitoxin stability system
VTMLEFRTNAARVLRRVARGDSLVPSHRGKSAARLEPMTAMSDATLPNDPFLDIDRRATASPRGKTTKHAEISRIIYGGR